MTIYIFLGPSLSVELARAELDAVYLPPVSQGDVYRATLEKPAAIGIIDGYFERIPAVWHKEILYAMSQGIHCFGSATMGALRAAELAPFGMEGVGKIYERFASGELEDDDEVAVAHSSPEEGYLSLSVAMVDIRATLAVAEGDAVISSDTHLALLHIAKALYYPQRFYPIILQRALQQGVAANELEALRNWLPIGGINQKRDDALALLRRIKAFSQQETEPKRVSYLVHHTRMWDDVVRGVSENRSMP